jgi:hypothetical protein
MATKQKTAAKKQSNKAPRTRASDDAKITPIGSNPFTPDSSRHSQLELARKAGTVAKFLKADGNLDYLSWFRRKGLVKVG